MNIKIDPTKALNVTVTLLTVVGTLLSTKAQANEKAAMKEEVLKEVMEKLNTK